VTHVPVLSLRRPDYLVLVVEDLDRALHFYTELLGLPLKHRSGAFAQLDTGEVRLALYTREAMSETVGETLSRPGPGAHAFELGFFVPDLDAAYAALVAAGAGPVIPPTDRPWGQRTAYVRDPDDNLVELVQSPG
jgi:lactoylglutathione lyase